MTKYTYKWLDPNSYNPDKEPHFTKKIRFTRGTFAGWTQPMGMANVPYAMFRTSRTEILIPKYDLTSETLAIIGNPPTRNDRLISQPCAKCQQSIDVGRVGSLCSNCQLERADYGFCSICRARQLGKRHHHACE